MSRRAHRPLRTPRFGVLFALLLLLPTWQLRAQTLILSEDFEGDFPGLWSTGNANPAGLAAYWRNVNSSFGGEATHSGGWKGYCAGSLYPTFSTEPNPLYVTNMDAFMSQSINLAGYTRATLRFWYKVPSIQSCCDSTRVFMDSTQLWITNNPVANWTQAAISLNSFVGAAHTLKFQFISDSSVVNEGTYLDDISVTASTNAFEQNILSMAITNYTGYIVAADANTNNAAYNRESILVRSVVSTESFNTASTATSFYLSYRLLDAATGVPFPIRDSTGQTNTSYTYNLTNSFTLAPLVVTNITNLASIFPAARMNPYAQYTVELRVFRSGVFTGRTALDGPRTYYHFTNTVNGDAVLNVIGTVDSVNIVQAYAVDSSAGNNAFLADVTYDVRRYDAYLSAAASANVGLLFTYQLIDATGAVVSLVSSSSNVIVSVPSWVTGPPNTPGSAAGVVTLRIDPTGQLNSVSNSYRLNVTMTYTNQSGQAGIVGNSLSTPLQQLLHFNGRLLFGSIQTTINSLSFEPFSVDGPFPGGYVTVWLPVASAQVNGDPAHTLTDSILDVRLRANGDAELNSGFVTLNAPSPDADSVNRIRFTRGPVSLTTTGATSTIKLALPTGFSYATNAPSMTSRLSFSSIQFTNTALNASLDPAADLTFSPGMTIYSVEETKPLWIPSSTLIWHVATGSIEAPPSGPAVYVRRPEYAYLASQSNALANPFAMAVKRANDRYLEAVTGWDSLAPAPNVIADAKSNALISFKLTFGPGSFRTHFPYDSTIQWTAGGSLQIDKDLVVTTDISALTGAMPVSVAYDSGCPECVATPATNSPRINVGGVLLFSSDGGLVGSGPTVGTVDLRWGALSSGSNFAQQALGFSDGTFCMPGAFLRGDQNSLRSEHGPATILYTGVAATNLAVIERPLTPGYLNGVADYAGLNFRCLTDNSHSGRSILAGLQTGDWKLTGRSKYYVRASGVTGIHEAVPGTFPSSLILGGYAFGFGGYGVSYVDNQNADSRTQGALAIPYPAAFSQPFQALKFSCVGGLASARPPVNDGLKSLNYWPADLATLAIQFKHAAGTRCDPSQATVALGVQAFASHADQPLYGLMGFQTNGNLMPRSVARSYGFDDLDSRLKLPTVVSFDGPAGQKYSLTPVCDAYLNQWSSAVAASPGWMNIAGALDVPFFQDMKVHLQTAGRSNALQNFPIYVMGGWPRTGSSETNHGWRIGAADYFNASYFDENNDGVPTGVPLGSYRNHASEDYHPRGRKLWLDVADFDYPLSSSETALSFKSFEDRTNDFLIISAPHRVTYLDVKRAEIDFGVQYDALPSVSIANMSINAVSPTSGVAQALIQAASQPVKDVLELGFDDLDQLVSTRLDALFSAIFTRAVDPLVDALYGKLRQDWLATAATNRIRFGTNISAQISNYFGISIAATPVSTNLSYQLLHIADAGSSVTGLTYQVDSYIAEITNALLAIAGTISNSTNGVPIGHAVPGLLYKVDGGERDVARSFIGTLLSQLPVNYGASVSDAQVAALLRRSDVALQRVVDELNAVKAGFAQIHNKLQPGQEFANELNIKIVSLSREVTNVCAGAAADVQSYFDAMPLSIDDPFLDYAGQDVKKLIRQKVEERFFASRIHSELQTLLRQRFYDLDAQARTAVDSGFAQLNGAIRSIVGPSLAAIDNSASSLSGDLSGAVHASQINGHAIINGDSVKLVRLDGRFQWNVPDSMEFNGYLQIKELESDGTPGCSYSAGHATEVILGATGSDVSWTSPNISADLAAKFTFETVAGLKAVGLLGGMQLNGAVNFESLVPRNLAGAVSFSAQEGYISGNTVLEVQGWPMTGGAFFGRTCVLDPIKLWDPQVGSTLGNAPFAGAYVQGEGWVPIIGNNAPNCVFDMSAGLSARAFYFLDGPTYGGSIKGDIFGESLCVANVQGDINTSGTKTGSTLVFSGYGALDGKGGSCPFCVRLRKTIGIKYENGSWNINY